jgi:hypothetical protein
MNLAELKLRLATQGIGFSMNALSFDSEQLDLVWRTIGAESGHGGTHVLMDPKDGMIKGGPKALVGKNVSSLRKPKKEKADDAGGLFNTPWFDKPKPAPVTDMHQPVDATRQLGLFVKDTAGNAQEVGERAGQANLFNPSKYRAGPVEPLRMTIGSKEANNPANTSEMFPPQSPLGQLQAKMMAPTTEALEQRPIERQPRGPFEPEVPQSGMTTSEAIHRGIIKQSGGGMW